MKIAYLASQVTLPGSPIRRKDAFEHDYTLDELRPPFSTRGMEIVELSWDAAGVDWAGFDAVLIGTTWDYWDRQGDFLTRLEEIEAATRLFNPSALVRWNSHKGYLRDLEARGARLIPTLWIDKVTPVTAAEAFEALGSGDLVFKRQVGAGAAGQYRLKPGEPVPEMSHPMMVQPYLPAIAEEGEISFVMVDGALSHALLKRPASEDYRIQSAYGGVETPLEPSAADLAAAKAVLAALDEAPLYARVDMLRAEDGGLLLMELELIEPYLYPLQGGGLGERLAEALMGRLK